MKEHIQTNVSFTRRIKDYADSAQREVVRNRGTLRRLRCYQQNLKIDSLTRRETEREAAVGVISVLSPVIA